MKSYHSITKEITFASEAWVFDKKDGSNIRASWDKKKGFFQFGSRHKILNPETVHLGSAIELIKAQEAEFAKAFEKHKIKEATCFWEFLGENSLFGQHQDEKKELFLFDISVDKKGLLYPPKFMEVSEGLKTSPLLLKGEITPELIKTIQNRELANMSVEGVIVKLNTGSPGLPHMFKVKTHEWLRLLKEYCKDDKALFEKLA